MTIERNFDVALVAGLALREKQIQQNYRPIIAVHKWFARRPGTLFRGLLLSEFVDAPLKDCFFESNDLQGIKIADPFMGGGIPLLEANRIGCDVLGYDINPMSYWIVRQEIEHLDLVAYRRSAEKLVRELERKIGNYYRTTCIECKNQDAQVKYFLWVKVQNCLKCREEIDLFPGYLLAKDRRHPRNVLICCSCGELNEVADRRSLGNCRACRHALTLEGPARRKRCACPKCGESNVYPATQAGPPRHRMFAIEYFCPSCRPNHKGRFFKVPDTDDLRRYDDAHDEFVKMEPSWIPEDRIPSGDETNRLLRWGYERYSQMFNSRQLLGLELSCQAIKRRSDSRVRNALATNLSDLLRYQNMLCRYDTMALKSLDIFSIHGFPVSLIQCESNFIGISKGRVSNIGSGGWTNIIGKFSKAKSYADNPFEIRYEGKQKIKVPITGEWIGESRNGNSKIRKRKIEIRCGNSADLDLSEGDLDAVFTDPPYFGNVQYAELMDFCYVWLRRLVATGDEAFAVSSTRNQNELTGNVTLDRGLNHFMEGLSAVFQRMAVALKPGSPLAFTYHHNSLEAYYPIAVAILDAGLTCSASLPCPAEMSGSIHINGTGSSIIDTIFVCRSTGKVPRRWIVGSLEELGRLATEDLDHLRAAGVRLTRGDIRCIIYGHLTRLAIWRLRRNWDKTKPVQERSRIVEENMEDFGGVSAVANLIETDLSVYPSTRTPSFQEEQAIFGADDEISF